MTPNQYKFLTEDQVENFMKYGYLRIPEAFSVEKAASWSAQLWDRLGYSPTDKSTWLQERVNMPAHNREHVRTFSPKAWGAMCELLGGEDRIHPKSGLWSDGFIVNLGTEEWKKNGPPPPKMLENWHCDGDSFVHFLDSPEQGLLVIPIFSDIEVNGGGTIIATDGIGAVARHLWEHPEGVNSRMVPVGEQELSPDFSRFKKWVQEECSEFHEMTGKTGDVILMHPLMLHSVSKNCLRVPRIITNPLTCMKEPFNYDREDPADYSLVERKTLKELGVERLNGWKITGKRQRVIPERLRVHALMRETEERRLRGERVESTDITGVTHGTITAGHVISMERLMACDTQAFF
ncbi:uncharacterized protein H6S33_003244 [Morchella sextelata]|uniref:uncharacterized protein n=1 Tax=Morchella sextelata TaxID=1174677 RepID=UPI001D05B9F0|nr:uncharacterized protein H6S33_003244 [Morchella sextelata]KAH0607256.1 hypothetical protein H6S33_003244 [Morchella sextelata]